MDNNNEHDEYDIMPKDELVFLKAGAKGLMAQVTLTNKTQATMAFKVCQQIVCFCYFLSTSLISDQNDIP
jgi:hypothetical protein